MSIKSMLLITNPTSGQGKFAGDFFNVAALFVKNGFEVTVYPTSGPRHAYQITLDRASDFDYLVCCGGDGTLNEVISALMLLERRPLLGHIPSGSSNDFAATHGLLADSLSGAQIFVEGKPTAIDIGAFQDGFFCYVAAFGLFSDVSYDTPQNQKNMLGHLAYVLQGVKKLASIRYHRCRIELDDEVIEGDFIFGMIANSRSVGGFDLPLEIDVCLDDGVFELVLLRRIHRLEKLAGVIATLMGSKGPPDSSFIVRRAKRVRITCENELSWSIDGEYGGDYKVTEISVRHKAIEIIAPDTPGLPPKKRRRTLKPRA
ncbi:MAG: YegS/Rv2252/BmrU family lipid kinase [Oscillospiraceae bacterium]|nr:YegS/Rv2252/BmrU family lipid kinase [Oscillospiraceae bacterium]